MPVYAPASPSEDGSDIPGVLVGVVGHDTRVQDLAGETEEPDSIVARLAHRSMLCDNLDLIDCQFQVGRFYRNEVNRLVCKWY